MNHLRAAAFVLLSACVAFDAGGAQDGRVADTRNVRYESCWAPITSDEGSKVAGRRLTLKLDDLREEVRREVSYDADSPEAGLSVKESAVPKSNP
ncbi:MAG: hypothetical protein ABR603_05380 [Pyrinomonadaceae bacterium]